MILLLLFFLRASPQQDLRTVLNQEKGCDAAYQRLGKQVRFLQKKQKSGEPNEVLISTAILLDHHTSVDTQSLRKLFFQQLEDQRVSPSPLAIRICQVLQRDEKHDFAFELVRADIKDYWLYPCLPILIRDAFTDKEIWDHLVVESTSLPNSQEIRTLLKRRGTVFFPRFLSQLTLATSTDELHLLHDIIWGLSPIDITPEARKTLLQTIQNGPILISDRTAHIQLYKTHITVAMSILARFEQHPESRVFTPASQHIIDMKGTFCPVK